MSTKLEQNSRLFSLNNIRQGVVGIDTKVPLLDGSQRQYIFLDNAASTPVLREVLDSINDFMPWYSSVHRGSGYKSRLATKAYDDARQIVMDFFGANGNDHVVIFGKNTTEAVNKLSYRLDLTKKDVVLVGMLEHHSNDLPWRRAAEVHHIAVDKNGALLDSSLDELLDKYKARVKLVAISGGSNVTGCIPDVHSIAKKVHAAGAQIMVDCAQLAPHRKINIKNLNDPEHLDYIAVSAHKMYAPFGTGALIGRRDTFERGEPELCGGGTISTVTEDTVEWSTPPDKDEAGSPNVVGAIAFGKALKILTQIGMGKIADHEADLTEYLLAKLSQIKGLELYGDSDPSLASSRLGVVSFNVEGMFHSLVSEILAAEWGIGVRNGCFCAHPYVLHLLGLNAKEIKDFVDSAAHDDRRNLPGMVRVSFGMYNTKEEIDYLIKALDSISLRKHSGKYTQDKKSGEYSAVGWELDFSSSFKL